MKEIELKTAEYPWIKQVTERLISKTFLSYSMADVMDNLPKIESEITKEIIKSWETKTNLMKEFVNLSYLDSDDFHQIFYQTIMKAKSELYKEQRELYSDFLLACCLERNLHCPCKRLFLHIIEKITSIDIELIKIATKDNYNNDFIKKAHSCITKNKVISETEIIMHTYYLESIGLLKKGTKIEYESLNKLYKSDSYCKTNYYKSKFGNSFSEFIDISKP